MTSNLVENFAIFTLNMLNSFVLLLLKPIDSLLTTFIPSFDTITLNISNFLEYIYDIVIFMIEWLHLPSGAIALIVAYISFRITLFFSMMSVRLVIKWYKMLKH